MLKHTDLGKTLKLFYSRLSFMKALKPSLEHDRKHIVRLLRLYGDSN